MRRSLRTILIWAFIFLLAFVAGRRMDAPRHVVRPITPTSSSPSIRAGDERQPLARFALAGAPDQARLRRELRATQSLSCDSGASLVHRADVILFAAHEILDEDGTLRSDFKDCDFLVTTRDTDGHASVERYPIDLASLDYGPLVERGADSGDKWLQSNMDDWAVARLVRPVAGIAPYRLIRAAAMPAFEQAGARLVTISPPTSNWHGENSYIAESCTSLPRDDETAMRFPSLILSDCYSGPGASGSALLADFGHGELAYLGTMIAVDRPCMDGAPTCTSTSRLLDADLVARIEGTSALDGADGPQRQAQAERLDKRRAIAVDVIGVALDAPVAARDDPTGRQVADLYAQMTHAFAAARWDETLRLDQAAMQALGDAAMERPELPALARLEGDALRKLGRPQEAFESYAVAKTSGDHRLAGYLALRLGETVTDQEMRRFYLGDAYRIGGRTLFARYGDLAEIPGSAKGGAEAGP